MSFLVRVCRRRILWGAGLGMALAAVAAPSIAAKAEVSAKAEARAAVSLSHPILFVTQVPVSTDFAARASTFGNHQSGIRVAPRGGDLMIRYPDGSLRALTAEAGYGQEGMQGAQAIAVREPSVHWSGRKALFSMVVGAPAGRYNEPETRWQIYEVTGLGRGETARITRVPNQPAPYNNVSPFYGTDDRVLFTSDRPRGGEGHLYPQLDEYESTPTNTGIWSLDPASGDMRLLTHAISGAFSPFIDSHGRVVYTRWDHLQRDQQADAGTFGAYDTDGEAKGAARRPGPPVETFPEPRKGDTGAYGPTQPYTFNQFTPWEINEDGTQEETLNHIGRHEMQFVGMRSSFVQDKQLLDNAVDGLRANQKFIRGDGGILQIREDPKRPGQYVAVYGREFGELGANQLVRFQASPDIQPERMSFVDASDPSLKEGRFRNPLPLADGRMVATHSPRAAMTAMKEADFRLRALTLDPATGWWRPGPLLTPGIRKALQWYDPDELQRFDGLMWELEAVEVVARPRPATRVEPALDRPERQVLQDEGVDEQALRRWMKDRGLALMVTRNQTARDRADRQQPYNLAVPGGVKSIKDQGRVYSIAHYQIFQADQVRGYEGRAGRRPLARPMHGAAVQANPRQTGGPEGSVKIAADGSTAAFVPAQRALTWQTTDAAGNAVVRERVWVTFQPGEIRVCAACHGVNVRDQVGRPSPSQPPEALRQLVRLWARQGGAAAATSASTSASAPRDPP